MMKIFVVSFLLLPVVLANEEDSLTSSCSVPPSDTILSKNCKILSIGAAVCNCVKCQGIIFMKCNKMGEWKPDENKENTMECLECQSTKFCNEPPDTRMWSNCKLLQNEPNKKAVCECIWCRKQSKVLICGEDGLWNGENKYLPIDETCRKCRFSKGTFPRSCNIPPPDTNIWNNCWIFKTGEAYCGCVECRGSFVMKCNKMGKWEADKISKYSTDCLQCRNSTKDCNEHLDSNIWSNCRIYQHEPIKKLVCECSECPERKANFYCHEKKRWFAENVDQTIECLGCNNLEYVCPSTLRCDGKGNSHICLCKSNCQNAVEECSGHNGMSIDISQCSVETGTMNITKGKEVRWVTTQSGIELGCLDGPSTVKRGSVSCSRGKLDNVTMPICTNLPCKAPPKTMTCDLNNELLDITNNCTCNDNCRKVNIQCRNETWEYDHNICLSPFEKHPFPIPDGTTVNITALKQNYSDRFSFKVHCTDDELNVVEPGSATCENGVLNVKKKPICENNSSTFMMNDKYVTIPTAVLGCLLFICIIYVTVKKIQKHRMPLLRAADDEEVLYDEIDLRFAVEPPVPEPPPRVHDGHGYLLVNEPYQYDVVGEERPLEKWIKPIAEVSDDVEQDDVNQDPLSHNAEVPENEDPILHNPEEPEDEDPMLHKPEVPKDENPMLLKPEMPKDVDEKPECPQLEKSEYVDQNKLHRYKTEMPNRPKLPDYVDQNDLEQCQAKISHKPKVFEDVEQNEDKVIRSIEESVNVDEPEFQESKYVDHNDLHRYKVKMPYRPKLPDYVDQNDLEQCQSKISHKPKVFEDVEQNEDKVICSLEESVNVDEPEFQESKYVDHNDLHRYKVKMPYRPKLPDYVDENDFEQR